MKWKTIGSWAINFALAGMLLQLGYIRGFDHGADTTLCVVGYAMDGEKALTELDSCKGAENASNSVFRHGLILYRELMGDAVHFDSENKVIM